MDISSLSDDATGAANMVAAIVDATKTSNDSVTSDYANKSHLDVIDQMNIDDENVDILSDISLLDKYKNSEADQHGNRLQETSRDR